MEVVAILVVLACILIFQGLIYKWFYFSALDYVCSFSSKEVYEGDDVQLVETVYNKKLLPLPWLKVEIYTSSWLDFAGTNSVVAQKTRFVTSSFLLWGYQKTVRRWKVKCMKRGIFKIKNVTLVGGDLFGTYIVSKPYEVNASIIVYPTILELEELLVPLNLLPGSTLVRKWILDDPFYVSGVREYTSHDPMNRIHWASTARHGSPMVRKHDFTSEVSLTVILNIQSTEYEQRDVIFKELIELGIKIAATLFDMALVSGMPVRFCTNGGDGNSNSAVTSRQAAGRSHISELMYILASLDLSCKKSFEKHLGDLSGAVTNSNVIIITAYLNDNICQELRNHMRRGNNVSLILLDKRDDAYNIPNDINIYTVFGG